VGHPSLASEFPNDNAAISGGAIWVCAELTGPATAEVAPYEPVAAEPFVLCFDDEEDYLEGPMELRPSAAGPLVVIHSARPQEGSTEPELELDLQPEPSSQSAHEPAGTEQAAAPETPSAFRHFEGALVSALMSHGASRAAAVVPKLLRLEPLPAESLSKEAQLTLQSRGYLEGSARYSQKFRDLCGAWASVLHGSSQDLGACGTTTLDRFGAELLAALLAVPATRADELRRELRKAGIAAFGVLEAA
jgi:hypothetical protein